MEEPTELYRASNTQVRTVTSSIHHGRPCEPCILCKAGNLSKYFHQKSWKGILESLRKCEPSINIQLDSCICRPCRDDISRLCDDKFVPIGGKDGEILILKRQ